MKTIDHAAQDANLKLPQKVQVQLLFNTLGHAVFAKAAHDTRTDHIECLIIDSLNDLLELHALPVKRLTVTVEEAK